MATDLFPAGFGSIDLPEELAALADGDLKALEYLVLAEAWRDADHMGRVAISGQALRLLPGTTGTRIIAWEDLRDVVAEWHQVDVVLDTQGRHDYLHLPTREGSDQRVVDVLAWIRGVVRAVSA